MGMSDIGAQKFQASMAMGMAELDQINRMQLMRTRAVERYLEELRQKQFESSQRRAATTQRQQQGVWNVAGMILSLASKGMLKDKSGGENSLATPNMNLGSGGVSAPHYASGIGGNFSLSNMLNNQYSGVSPRMR